MQKLINQRQEADNMRKGYSYVIFALIFAIALAGFASAVSIRDVSSNPSQVAPGGTTEISIRIENIFDYTVTNMDVKLDLSSVPFAPYQSSSEKFLDELDESDDKTFSFELIALPSAATGIYKIPVNISYENDNGARVSEQELISMTVNSAPQLTVSADTSNILIKGQDNTLSVKVINSGLSDVKFLYISLADSGGISILSAREQYIGSVTSDDFDTVNFNVNINQNAFSTATIPVTLRYLDSTNKAFTETKQITVKTYSADEAQKLGLVPKANYSIYFIIIIIAAIYFIYRFLKKRRLKKQRS
jgi:hypothetical protein